MCGSILVLKLGIFSMVSLSERGCIAQNIDEEKPFRIKGLELNMETDKMKRNILGRKRERYDMCMLLTD